LKRPRQFKPLKVKNITDAIFFALSDNAARQSGPEEKYAEAFSPMGSAELWAVSRHKALRAKNIASAIFFALYILSQPFFDVNKIIKRECFT
jgi:predicted metal-binding protein